MAIARFVQQVLDGMTKLIDERYIIADRMVSSAAVTDSSTSIIQRLKLYPEGRYPAANPQIKRKWYLACYTLKHLFRL